MIFLLIAGSYTPFGLLVLSGAWQVVVLAIVWSGVGVAILLKLIWINGPKWVAAGIGIGIGWVGIAAVPPLLRGVGLVGLLLVLAGGLSYTAGAIVYARRRPDPLPAVFGYHELFHAFVIVAVGCQYASVAVFVL
jgi:hemolysin III